MILRTAFRRLLPLIILFCIFRPAFAEDEVAAIMNKLTFLEKQSLLQRMENLYLQKCVECMSYLESKHLTGKFGKDEKKLYAECAEKRAKMKEILDDARRRNIEMFTVNNYRELFDSLNSLYYYR